MSDPTDPTAGTPPPPPAGGSTPPPPPSVTPPPAPGSPDAAGSPPDWSGPPPTPGEGGTGGGNRKPLLIIGGIIALIVLIAGGIVIFTGDDDGGGETLSEEEFVAQFSEICRDVDDQIEALDADSVDEAREAATEAQGIVNTGIDRLRDLQAPSDIADEVSSGIDALAQTGDVFGQLANIDDEDDFAETAGQIPEARSEAEDILSPLGIECEGGATDNEDSGDGAPGADGDDGSSDGGAVGPVPDPEPAADISDYGSDSDLDELADNCEAGDFDACDSLFIQAEGDSSYQDYGDTCGDRNESGPFCTTLYGDAE